MFRKLFITFIILFGFSQIFAEPSDVEFNKHAEQLKTKLKNRGFTVLIEKPFVVILVTQYFSRIRIHTHQP